MTVDSILITVMGLKATGQACYHHSAGTPDVPPQLAGYFLCVLEFVFTFSYLCHVLKGIYYYTYSLLREFQPLFINL